MKNLLNIPRNIESSKRLLKAGIISTPLVLLPACVNENKMACDCFEKHQIEYVDKISQNDVSQESFITKLDKYDKSILDDIKKDKGKEPINRPLSRLLVGLTAAAFGGLVGCVQKEHNAKLGAAIGGIIGASLPGITTASIVTFLAGLLSSGIAGVIDNKIVGYAITGGVTALAAAMCFL